MNLIPNLTKELLTKEVLQALNYAIDRDAISKNVMAGLTKPSINYVSTVNFGYKDPTPKYTYDPDKARFHMQKAGMLDYTFKLHAADAAFGGAVDTAVLYKEHAAKAGIKVEVVREPNDGYWSNVWMKKPWVMCYWTGRATADWMFSTAYAADAAWNDTFWKHERFNKLLKEARAELNEKRRHELYVECQKILRNEGGVVIPMFANHIEAANNKIRFEQPAGNWELDGNRAAERWWFES